MTTSQPAETVSIYLFHLDQRSAVYEYFLVVTDDFHLLHIDRENTVTIWQLG